VLLICVGVVLVGQTKPKTAETLAAEKAAA
jgi:hypothetical protein